MMKKGICLLVVLMGLFGQSNLVGMMDRRGDATVSLCDVPDEVIAFEVFSYLDFYDLFCRLMLVSKSFERCCEWYLKYVPNESKSKTVLRVVANEHFTEKFSSNLKFLASIQHKINLVLNVFVSITEDQWKQLLDIENIFSLDLWLGEPFYCEATVRDSLIAKGKSDKDILAKATIGIGLFSRQCGYEGEVIFHSLVFDFDCKEGMAGENNESCKFTVSDRENDFRFVENAPGYVRSGFPFVRKLGEVVDRNLEANFSDLSVSDAKFLERLSNCCYWFKRFLFFFLDKYQPDHYLFLDEITKNAKAKVLEAETKELKAKIKARKAEIKALKKMILEESRRGGK